MERRLSMTKTRDGRTKNTTLSNDRTQRECIKQEDAASSTAMTKTILLTRTIDAKQGFGVMTADIPNSLVQTKI
jgi:hypothetical protein